MYYYKYSILIILHNLLYIMLHKYYFKCINIIHHIHISNVIHLLFIIYINLFNIFLHNDIYYHDRNIIMIDIIKHINMVDIHL